MLGTIIKKSLLYNNDKESCELYKQCAEFCNKNKGKYIIKEYQDYFEVVEYVKEEPTEKELLELEIINLKQELAKTDYQAIKFSEGWFTDEEYAPIKAMREEIREKIRDLESQLIN